MVTVTLYTCEQCPECDQALYDLKSLQEEAPHQLVTINPSNDPALLKTLGPLPVVEIGPYHKRPPFNRQDLLILLKAAHDRVDQLQRVDQAAYQKRVKKSHTLSKSDRVSVWISTHYMLVINLLLGLYVGLSVLAPVLMKENQPLLANVIYKAYSPLCHQLAFRSFFLFGQQAYYPRELAGVPGAVTYETLVNSKDIDSPDAGIVSQAMLVARDFYGNESAGFKIALCERCVAMYGIMLFFGLIYSLFRKHFRPIPWYAWVILGLVPIGIDGVSQLPSLMPWLPSWLSFPIRESTPLFRVVTGGMFGIMTGWYMFPILEEAARETRMLFQRKKTVIEQISLVEDPTAKVE